MMTGLRQETFENLQLNAGVFLEDFAYASITDSDALEEAVLDVLEAGTGVLGATRGGGSFEVTPETRTIEADGMRNAFVGSTIVDGWTVQLKTTLLEAVPGNFKRALPGAEAATSGKKTTIKLKNGLATADYISKLVWIGDTSEGLVLIALKNVLNIDGMTFTFTDKGEGTIPVTFKAHQDDLSDQEYAPFEIIFFDKPDPTPDPNPDPNPGEGG